MLLSICHSASPVATPAPTPQPGPSPCSLQTLKTSEVAERGTEIDASAIASEVPAMEAARAGVCRLFWAEAPAGRSLVRKVLVGGACCGSVTQAQRALSAHRPSAFAHPFQGAPFPSQFSLPAGTQCPILLGQLLGPVCIVGMKTVQNQPKNCKLRASTA